MYNWAPGVGLAAGAAGFAPSGGGLSLSQLVMGYQAFVEVML
jgi:hypothetical protein